MTRRKKPKRMLGVITDEQGRQAPITSPTVLRAIESRDERIRAASDTLNQLANELGSTRTDLAFLELSPWVRFGRWLRLPERLRGLPEFTHRARAAVDQVLQVRRRASERRAQRTAGLQPGEIIPPPNPEMAEDLARAARMVGGAS